MSDRFKKEMVEVLAVPFFEGVRIHAGVTVDDSEGCPLLRPLFASSLQGPTLTDSLTTLIKQTPGHHKIQIIEGLQA